MIACKLYYLGGIEQEGVNCLVLEFEKNLLIFNFGNGNVPDDVYGVTSQVPDYSHFTRKLEEGYHIVGLFLNSFASKHMGGLAHLLKDIPNIPIYCSTVTARIIKRSITLKHSNHKSLNLQVVSSGKTITFHTSRKMDNYVSIHPFNTLSKTIGSLGYYVRIKDQAFCIMGDFVIGPKQSQNSYNDVKTLMKTSSTHPPVVLTCDAGNISNFDYTYPNNMIISTLEEVINPFKKTIIVIIDLEESNLLLSIIRQADRIKKNVVLVGGSLNYHYQVFQEAGDINPKQIKVLNASKIKENEFVNAVVIYSDTIPNLTEKIYEEYVGITREDWKWTIEVALVAIQYRPIWEVLLLDVISELSKYFANVKLLTWRNYLGTNASFLDITTLYDIIGFQGHLIVENVDDSKLVKIRKETNPYNLINPINIQNFEVLEFTRNKLKPERTLIHDSKSQKFTTIREHQITSKIFHQRSILSSDGIISIAIFPFSKQQNKTAKITIESRGVFASKELSGKIESEMKKQIQVIMAKYSNLEKNQEIWMEDIKDQLKRLVKKNTKKIPFIDVCFLG